MRMTPIIPLKRIPDLKTRLPISAAAVALGREMTGRAA
jgi:hypothetical protein